VKIASVLVLLILIVGTLVGCGPDGTQAKFSATPNNSYSPLDVQFTDLSTGNITNWQWDFNNDGTVDSTDQNPQYTYSDAGNYTVNLTVIGNNGNDTEVKKDYIKAIPCPGVANFIAEPTSGRSATKVQFTDMSTGNITSWAWDFESDGVIDSTEQNPSHVYSRNGLYSVTLTIATTECPDTLTRYDYINITGCG
jgi:PKD repeat protein